MGTEAGGTDRCNRSRERVGEKELLLYGFLLHPTIGRGPSTRTCRGTCNQEVRWRGQFSAERPTGVRECPIPARSTCRSLTGSPCERFRGTRMAGMQSHKQMLLHDGGAHCNLLQGFPVRRMPTKQRDLTAFLPTHSHDAMCTAAAAAQRADGDGELMTLTGILPVDLSSGTKYEVPVCVWIPREYPDQPPELCVLPTSTGLLPEFPHAVAEGGRCELPYCRS